MSEQPTNLPEAPACPTDDEVLAKRDDEITALRAENMQLRTALQQISDWCPVTC